MPKSIENQARHEKTSHKILVRDRLLAGKTITQADFIKMTGNLSARLAPRILNLREDGYDIINPNEHKYSHGIQLPAEYRLTDAFLKRVNEYGLENTLQAERAIKEAVC